MIRWTAGSAVALYERLDRKRPWSARRAVLRLIRQLEGP
jgi:hypothetical protein